MNPDRDHLKLLSIFHFILGGFGVLVALFPVIHLLVGIGLISGFFPPDPSNQGPELFVGWFFIVLASFMILFFLTLAALSIYAGVCLAAEKKHSFCMAVACIECLAFPFGTILGVVTLMVLLRPSVKELFGVAPSVPVPIVPTAGEGAV